MPRTVWLCIAMLAFVAGCNATAADLPSATATAAPSETATPSSTPTGQSSATPPAFTPTPPVPPMECSWAVSGAVAGISSMEAMTWMSHLVVAGQVVERLPAAFGDPLNQTFQPGPPIYTDFILEIERQFRGLPADTVRIRRPGGTIGDCVQLYDPSPQLVVGARVLLFLAEDQTDALPPPAYNVTGVTQGLFKVARNNTVVNDLDPEIQPQRMTLDEVAELIYETLAGDPPPDAFQPVPLEDAPPVLP